MVIKSHLISLYLSSYHPYLLPIKFFLTMAPENVDLQSMLESGSDDQEDRGEQDQDVPMMHPSGVFILQ